MDEFKTENINEQSKTNESVTEPVAEPVVEQQEFKESSEENIPEENINNEEQPAEYEVNSDVNNAGTNSNFSPFNYYENPKKQTPVVNIQKPKHKETETTTGIKIFSSILALVIVAGIFLVGGYFLGKGSNKSINKTNISTVIQNKPTDENAKNAAEIFEIANKSVVYIKVYNESNTQSSSAASGVIYSKSGYILTCDHIYSSVTSPKFKVTLYNGKEYDAKFVAGDTRSDLAVLKIKAENLDVAEFGNSSENIVGEQVFAVGYSCGFSDGASITTGIISANNRRVTSTTTSYSTTFTQIDSAINPGNSGGALFNAYGQVVGITSSKISGTVYEGVGFAIPSINATSIADSLIKNGYVKGRPKLGITYSVIDSVIAEQKGLPSGLCINEISSDSELYSKNISKGSIITHLNGEKITSANVLLNVIDNSTAGDSLTLTIYDSTTKESKDYTVKLIEDKGSSSYTEKSDSDEAYNSSEESIFGKSDSTPNEDNNLPF